METKMNDKSIHSSHPVQSLHLWWVPTGGFHWYLMQKGLSLGPLQLANSRLLVVTSVGLVYRLAPAINTGSKGPYQSGLV